MEEELDDSYLESVLGQFEVVEEVDDKAVKEGEDFMKLLEENMSALLANGSNSQIENQGQPKEFQDTISQTLSKLRTSSNEAEVLSLSIVGKYSGWCCGRSIDGSNDEGIGRIDGDR